MDITPFYHAGISLSLQIVWGLVFGDWITGAALSMFFWFGREHAQAEYRYRDSIRGTDIPTRWYSGFKPSAWNKGSVLDIVAPFVFCLFTYLVVSRLQLLGINFPILFGG